PMRSTQPATAAATTSHHPPARNIASAFPDSSATDADEAHGSCVRRPYLKHKRRRCAPMSAASETAHSRELETDGRGATNDQRAATSDHAAPTIAPSRWFGPLSRATPPLPSSRCQSASVDASEVKCSSGVKSAGYRSTEDMRTSAMAPGM